MTGQRRRMQSGRRDEIRIRIPGAREIKLAIAALPLTAILMSGCGPEEVGEQPAPSPATQPVPPSTPPVAPTVWEATSTRGAYQVRIRPEEVPIPLNRIHRWRVVIEDTEGHAVVPDAVSVGGGMPQHGHGFVTAPEATPGPDGEVVIDGMKFHMAGAWRLDLGIMGPQGFDAISFEIQVAP